MWLLRKIAFPVSLVYALVVSVRNFLFDLGWFKSQNFATPLLCVGNLSVGGTGKTPMVEFLLRMLHGHDPAVLSRGYGRKSEGFVMASPETPVTDLGDEPFQIHRKFPEITVAVDADRAHGIAILEKERKPAIIVLDDAFQHRKVTPNFSILLTAYQNLYPQDWYLPTGNLRDSKREARRAQVIVVTKCPETLSLAEKERIIKLLRPNTDQQVLFSSLAYGALEGDGMPMTLEALQDKEVVLVTGIANPKPLLEYVESKGIVPEHWVYGDHHFFSEKEIAAMNQKPLVLTTEKDYVRLQGKVQNLYYIPIQHQFMDGGEQVLRKMLEPMMKQGS